MIENESQLEQTRRAIAELEDALQSLKTRVFPENPALFEAMASDYVTAICDLRADVDAYIGVNDALESAAPLWLRVIGDGFTLWSTPASVWEITLARLRRSVTSVAEFLAQGIVRQFGRPLSTVSDLADFRVVAIRPGSLQIGVTLPSPSQLELFPSDEPNVAESALTKLLLASEWFAREGSPHELEEMFPSRDERNIIVAKTVELMPQPRGKIRTLEFRGAIIPSRTAIRLVADQRKRLREILPTPTNELPQTHEGVIREVDLDRGQCILRQRPDNLPDLLCRFDPPLLAQIKEALDQRVRLEGTIREGTTGPLRIQLIELL
jgi:hypothetical protein